MRTLQNYLDLENLKEVLKLEHGLKDFSLSRDEVVEGLIYLSSNLGLDFENDYIHEEDLENYLQNKGGCVYAFQQGQGIQTFNDNYYYIDGYENLQNVTKERIEINLFDIKNAVIDELEESLEEYIEEFLEDEEFIYLFDRIIKYNGINYIIEEKNHVIAYGSTLKSIIHVITAYIKCKLIMEVKQQ